MIVFDVNQHGWLLRNSRIDRSYVQYVSETKKKKKERKGDRNISNTACAKCSLYSILSFAFANYCKWRNISRCSSFLCFWKVTDKLRTNFWLNLHISKYHFFFNLFVISLINFFEILFIRLNDSISEEN